METSAIVGLVITSVSGLLIIVMSIFLLAGKGSFLIAGYNTISEKEKANYDAVALSKFIGKIMLPIGILLPGLAIAAMFNISWYITLFRVAVFGLPIFAIIYCNTGNRFRK